MKPRILFIAPDSILYETADKAVKERAWEEFVTVELGCDSAGLSIVRKHREGGHLGIISRGGTADLIQHWNPDLAVDDVGFDTALILLQYQALDNAEPGSVAISCVDSLLPSQSTITEATRLGYVRSPKIIEQPEPGEPQLMEEALMADLRSFAGDGGKYLICDNFVDQLALRAGLEPKLIETPASLVVEKMERMFERLCTVFVIMSFSRHHSEDDVFNMAIKPTLAPLGFNAFRMDEDTSGERILPAIEEEIRKSPFVIAEISEERPNTYYELGFARGLGKPVIILARTGTEVHFDVTDLPRVEYDTLSDLREKLNRLISNMIE